jgi:hypothetical protein
VLDHIVVEVLHIVAIEVLHFAIITVDLHIDLLLHTATTITMDFHSLSFTTILLNIVTDTIVTMIFVIATFNHTSIIAISKCIATALIASKIIASFFFF